MSTTALAGLLFPNQFKSRATIDPQRNTIQSAFRWRVEGDPLLCAN